jgi:hypothetical protein
MLIFMIKGIAFWYVGDEDEKKHLYFVISESDVDGKVLAVNIATLHKPEISDNSCVLDVADYPKIEHKSFVFYHEALEAATENIMTKPLTFNREKTRLTDKTLRKTQEGAKKSKFFPKKLKKYFEYF